MKTLILVAALAASFLTSACTVVHDHEVERVPSTTVIRPY